MVRSTPPPQTVNLGLDLKGGVHLVLRVQTDDALRLETETAMERLREELVKGGAASVTATAQSVNEFQIAGVTPDHDAQLRQAATEVEQTYDRDSGVNGTYTFKMKPNIANQLRTETVDQAIRTIERRVNELGVAEPIVAKQGAQDQIMVELPGVTDVVARQGDHPVDVAPRAEAGRAGPGELARAADDQRRRAAGHRDPVGRVGRPRRRRRHRLLPGAPRAGR